MNKIAHKNGFTLVEALIATSIVVLISIGFWNVFKSSLTYTNTAQGRLMVQHELQLLSRRMTAELRAAVQSDTGAYALATTASSSIAFYVDADSDGLHERIRYFKEGNELKKGVLKPSGSPLTYTGAETIRTVVHNLSATTTPVFVYYGSTYPSISTAPLTEPVITSSVRLVRITVAVDDNSTTPIDPIVSTTQVSIRTLKDNL